MSLIPVDKITPKETGSTEDETGVFVGTFDMTV